MSSVYTEYDNAHAKVNEYEERMAELELLRAAAIEMDEIAHLDDSLRTLAEARDRHLADIESIDAELAAGDADSRDRDRDREWALEDFRDEGFDCCRNQGTAFCDHGPGSQAEGW